jgi:hypothetical protein
MQFDLQSSSRLRGDRRRAILNLVQDCSSRRSKRTPGGDPYVCNKHFRDFIGQLILNDPRIGTLNGRVLRLKDYLSPDASSAQLDMVLDALKENVRLEVLYIQNFEKVCRPGALRGARSQVCGPAELSVDWSCTV